MGKHYYLELTKRFIDILNENTDQNGISMVRKSMVLCVMSLGLDSQWNVAQLINELLQVVEKYSENFNGLEPDEPVGED